MNNECNFSESVVTLSIKRWRHPQVIVECPECGSVRTIKVPVTSDPLCFPRHKTVAGASATHTRARWQRQENGNWQWIARGTN